MVFRCVYIDVYGKTWTIDIVDMIGFTMGTVYVINCNFRTLTFSKCNLFYITRLFMLNGDMNHQHFQLSSYPVIRMERFGAFGYSYSLYIPYLFPIYSLDIPHSMGSRSGLRTEFPNHITDDQHEFQDPAPFAIDKLPFVVD